MNSAISLHKRLENLYSKYNRRKFVHPDPLEFLYNYKTLRDREIVGLIAASLAYGRVAQILKSVGKVLDGMGTSPFGFLEKNSERTIKSAFSDCDHRFATGSDVSGLLIGMKRVIGRHGSLEGCFSRSCHPRPRLNHSGVNSSGDPVNAGDSCWSLPSVETEGRNDRQSVISALSHFVRELTHDTKTNLLPLPERGSACKRLNLFLRWMIRKDAVDPGGWDNLPASRLVIPLDTHMHKIGLSLGLTDRKQADMRTVMEITGAFAAISPNDPVKYDFALTRLGIRADSDMAELTAGLDN